MPSLLLRLSAPMQSWGTSSRFNERDSQLEPSKSGVIGLLAAALGRDRAKPLGDLARLKMGVRVDREGRLLRDFQTATGVMTAGGKVDLDRTVVSPRYYLADAAFLVGLESEDGAFLSAIDCALRSPVWPLYLGRKSFPPTQPVSLKDALREQNLREVLLAWPRIAQPRLEHREKPLRIVLEHLEAGAVRLDQPVAPFSQRRFGPRYVVSETIHVPV